MQTVNIADLKNNLSAYLEQVRNGLELVVKDRNRPIARLLPLGVDLDAEEEALIASGLMRLSLEIKNDDFLDLPAPEVSDEIIRDIIRNERDEN
jgi:prevent-host-death family protein